MTNNFPDLPANTIDIIIQTAGQYPEIEKVAVFGSRAMGNAKPGSDIDLVIYGDKISQHIVTQFHMHLNEETNIPNLIDVIHYEAISTTELKCHIDDYGIKL